MSLIFIYYKNLLITAEKTIKYFIFYFLEPSLVMTSGQFVSLVSKVKTNF